MAETWPLMAGRRLQLNDNHAKMRTAKRRAKELALALNDTKRQIDDLTAECQEQAQERLAKGGEDAQVRLSKWQAVQARGRVACPARMLAAQQHPGVGGGLMPWQTACSWYLPPAWRGVAPSCLRCWRLMITAAWVGVQEVGAEELEALMHLREAKARYREMHGELQAVRSEAEYTQGLLASCSRCVGDWVAAGGCSLRCRRARWGSGPPALRLCVAEPAVDWALWCRCGLSSALRPESAMAPVTALPGDRCRLPARRELHEAFVDWVRQAHGETVAAALSGKLDADAACRCVSHRPMRRPERHRVKLASGHCCAPDAVAGAFPVCWGRGGASLSPCRAATAEACWTAAPPVPAHPRQGRWRPAVGALPPAAARLSARLCARGRSRPGRQLRRCVQSRAARTVPPSSGAMPGMLPSMGQPACCEPAQARVWPHGRAGAAGGC
jgi:hypothetical protein